MRPPIRLLLAATLCYYSLSALNWGISLHLDPWRAEDFAAQKAENKGINWPQYTFRELGGHEYEATYQATDNSGRYATVRVKKTDAGWQLVSLKEGQAEWRKHVAASR